jgi:hypothetical protein
MIATATSSVELLFTLSQPCCRYWTVEIEITFWKSLWAAACGSKRVDGCFKKITCDNFLACMRDVYKKTAFQQWHLNSKVDKL